MQISAFILSPSAADSVSGFIGGAAGLAAGHPFDTIRIRIQMNYGFYRGTLHCGTTMIQNEGVSLGPWLQFFFPFSI